MRDVGEVSAVGREAGVLGDGQGHLRGESAFDGHGIELIFEVDEAAAPRVEQNLLAVRSPAGDVFFSGVIGQAARHASRGGYDVHVAVAVIFAGESYLGAVRGEVRKHFQSDPGSKAAGIATVAADDP